MKTIRVLLPLCLLPLFLLTACAVGPDYTRPALELPAEFEKGSVDSKAGPATPDRWWTLFGDPVLNQLVESALERNTDLRLAVARVEETDANLREAGAALLPEIDAGIAGTRNRVSARTAVSNPPPLVRNDVRLTLATSFELDFWGRLRRVREAARAQALASRYGREVVAWSISSLVAQGYFSVRALDAQIVAASDSLATRRQSLEVASTRVERGLASGLDLNQARASVADATVLLRDLERQRELAQHQVAVLSGRLDLVVAPLAADGFNLALPALPAPGLPSRLLERRPDLRQAEQSLIAANAQIGVAKAAYFPTLILNANDGGESTALAGVLNNGARIWSVGVNAAAPLLDFGRTTARVDAATARAAQADALYRKAAETAFREVADALAMLRQAALSLQELQIRADATRDSLRIANVRYQAGYSAFLDVLDAQRSANDAALALARGRLAQLSAGVDLLKALGGGWGGAPTE